MSDLICNDCGRRKHPSEFYVNGGKPLQPCKDCRKEQKRRGLMGLKRIGAR